MSFRAHLHNEIAELRRWLSLLLCNPKKKSKFAVFDKIGVSQLLIVNKHIESEMFTKDERERMPVGADMGLQSGTDQSRSLNSFLIDTTQKFQPIVIGEWLMGWGSHEFFIISAAKSPYYFN